MVAGAYIIQNTSKTVFKQTDGRVRVCVCVGGGGGGLRIYAGSTFTAIRYRKYLIKRNIITSQAGSICRDHSDQDLAELL